MEPRRLTRKELEEIVAEKMKEAFTVKGICKELLIKVEKLTKENNEIKDKVSLLKKHLSDLTEASAKIKIERQSNTVKVPRITRNVGLQVNLSNSYSSKNTSAKKGSEMKTSRRDSDLKTTRTDSDLKTTPYVLKPGAEME